MALERSKRAGASIGKEDVELTLLLHYLCIQPVEVGHSGREILPLRNRFGMYTCKRYVIDGCNRDRIGDFV